jgi:hypothetical protein
MQWLIAVGISLNTIALFLDPDRSLRLAVLKAALHAAALTCFVVALTRLWRARRRRLQHPARDDLSTEDPRE